MGFSYQGIGEWCASFSCSEAAEGTVVKMDGSHAVKACSTGDAFIGVVRATGHDGMACSVQLGGMAQVPFTGEAPTAGYVKLAANGSGGVSVNNAGMSYLVVETDAENQVLTIKL